MGQFESISSRALIRNSLIIFFFATLILALEVALYSVRWIFLAVLIGVGLSVLLSPVMDFLKERLKVPQGVSALLFFILSLAVLGGLTSLLYALISKELVPFLTRLPDLLQLARSRLTDLSDIFFDGRNLMQSLDLSGALRNATQQLALGLRFGASAIGGFLFVIVLALYLAITPGYYLSGFLSLFPKHRQPHLQKVFSYSAQTLRRWFGSQLIAMAAVGIATGFGLWVVGIDYWLLFGALTAVFDIIPYIGPSLSAVSAVFVTFAENPQKVPWVIGVYVLMQQLESHLVIPLIMKERIDLPPAHLMILMLILGSWFGILGLLIAPGLLAVARAVYKKMVLEEAG